MYHTFFLAPLGPLGLVYVSSRTLNGNGGAISGSIDVSTGMPSRQSVIQHQEVAEEKEEEENGGVEVNETAQEFFELDEVKSFTK